MAITLDGTSGITTPAIASTGASTFTGTLDLPSGGLTVGTDQLAVDSSGRVTMPYQPAFRASYVGDNGGSYTVGVSAIVPFNTANSNVGGHYSTTTNRFTAPVAGHYHFNFIGFAYNSGAISAGSTAGVNLRVNGTIVTYLNYDYVVSSAGYNSLSGSNTMYLNANDYVEIYGTAGIYVDSSGRYTQFSGFLLG